MPITASGSSSDLNLNHFKIFNLTDPTVSSDAVNKIYVDRQITLVNSKITNPKLPSLKDILTINISKKLLNQLFGLVVITTTD